MPYSELMGSYIEPEIDLLIDNLLNAQVVLNYLAPNKRIEVNVNFLFINDLIHYIYSKGLNNYLKVIPLKIIYLEVILFLKE